MTDTIMLRPSGGFISLWMSPGFLDLNTRVCSPVKLDGEDGEFAAYSHCDRYALLILLSIAAKTLIFLWDSWTTCSPQISGATVAHSELLAISNVIFVCDNKSSCSILFFAFGSTRRTILRFNDSQSFNLS